MADGNVTIVVVPRERFGFAERSLASIYENTPAPLKLVYVDGGSPPRISRALQREATERGFTLIRTEHPLTPNEARNLGLREVDTPYVAFVDNDLIVAPGWLEKLVAAAEEQGAWIVAPTYLIGEPRDQIIHMAGGEAHFRDVDGQRRFHERHQYWNRPLAEVRDEMQSGPTELVEFHCMLVKTEVFDRFGPLDEGLMTHFEHIDLCLLVREAGGLVYHVADALVTYLNAQPFDRTDHAYYLLRWCDNWSRRTSEHFARKRAIAADDPILPHLENWGTQHRELILPELLWPLGRIARRLKYSRLSPIGKPLVRWIEAAVVGDLESKRPPEGKPRERPRDDVGTPLSSNAIS